MVDMNMIIADNIMRCLKQHNKKQTDLAEGIGTTKQTVNKMLNGSRMINAMELKMIADYLDVKMEELTRMPEAVQEEILFVFLWEKLRRGRLRRRWRLLTSCRI